ncbi:MAG TPA: PIN domain-containing protein [Candidatus Binataceae bacterium]|nr:PIN domain-containing protein [Candidatus Binataceae bacterium]
MELFFDTSVLVAAAVRHHPHHPQAARALRESFGGRHSGFLAVHSIAETYAVLTRLPILPAIHPSEALRIIEENFLAHLHPLSLGAKEYREVVKEVAEMGLKGGVIYDALLLRCARKRNFDRIYTFNVGHFRGLAPSLEERICAPA